MAQPILPPILAEGAKWLVIDKPAGLAVHPGPATPDSLEAILPGYAPNRPPPTAVHRLDRDTSGCLLLARTASAHRALARAFSEGAVAKLYWAIVCNPPDGAHGVIDAPLAKVSSADRGWRMIVDPRGKPARTGWQVLARSGELALIEFAPATGRTHQIRVHATRMAPGAAIVGDPVYGEAHPAGMMLHARALRFQDPADGAERAAEAPCPDRFRKLGFQV